MREAKIVKIIGALLVAMVAISLAPATKSHATPPTITSATLLGKLTLPINDIAWDQKSQKIYASVSGTSSSFPNTVLPFDPISGTLSPAIPVGSEPKKLAISDDGSYLYVGLNGAAAVRRVTMATQTADLQFGVGSDSFLGAFYVDDMAVLPGSPHTIAVSRRNQGFSPRHEGVAIYDDGVQRTNTTPGHTGSDVIDTGATNTVLYGLNNETTEFGYRVMAIDGSGVTTTKTVGSAVQGFGNDIKFANGRVYTTEGKVLDAATGTLVGTLPTQSAGLFGPFTVDPNQGLAYYVGTITGDTAPHLRMYDTSTFTQSSGFTLTGLTGTPSTLIRWGSNGVAFILGGSVYVVSLSSTASPAAIVNIDSPAPGAIQQPFNVSGWALDTGSLSGSGIDMVHVYMWASDANGNVPGGAVAGTQAFFGAANLGGSRPDLASIGSQFVNAGFSLPVPAQPFGSYLITVYAHSVVTNTWVSKNRVITIGAPPPPPTIPVISWESPQAGSNAPGFPVTGWSVDKGASSGTGVDAVHVYAWASDANGNVPGGPQAGTQAFFAPAAYGGSRPDVAGAIGPQFQNSGFSLAPPNLAPGNYLLVLYSHSTVSNSWNPVSRVVNIAGPTSSPLANIESPSAGVISGASVNVTGWSIDRGSASSSGVDQVHVYLWASDSSGNVPGGPVAGTQAFFAPAAYGGNRPDVAGVFGPQFPSSGFGLTTTPLAAGNYLMVVYSHSTISGNWNPSTRVISVGATPVVSQDNKLPGPSNALTDAKGPMAGEAPAKSGPMGQALPVIPSTGKSMSKGAQPLGPVTETPSWVSPSGQKLPVLPGGQTSTPAPLTGGTSSAIPAPPLPDVVQQGTPAGDRPIQIAPNAYAD